MLFRIRYSLWRSALLRILGMSIYMTVKQEEKQDAVERDSGVFPIVLPRDIL